MKSFFVLLAALTLSHAAYPAGLYGSVEALAGNAFVSDRSGSSLVVSVGMKIYEGQTIRSGSNTEVHVVTEDGGIIAVRPNTVFRVDEYKADGGSDDRVFTTLLKGSVRSITGWLGKHNASAYRLSTPNATIGTHGTDHETAVVDKDEGDEPGTYDTVNEGATLVKTPQGKTELLSGKSVFVSRSRAGAPAFIAQQPHFWAVRSLKIEGRIQQRKESLRDLHEQMRDSHIKWIKSNRGKSSQSSEGSAR